ncbi:hypothetical protein AVEN_197290-1 [Araneus ventricosus]|uniref:Reverse transcriptase domain-containing protein n=1 Tax=Araneus ventricosus TaxID=182803 RepID=A0A4Y2W073_ARAVE|nr:hypothetical protein AVEN_197290-1 [Araneus ventricosus]
MGICSTYPTRVPLLTKRHGQLRLQSAGNIETLPWMSGRWLPGRINPYFSFSTKLFSSMNSNLDADLLQSDLDCLFKCCTVNKLHLNIEKCSILSYTRKSQPLNHVYKINDLVLSRSDSVTDLGIIFDTKLDFSHHINSMVCKAYRRLGIFKRKTKEFSSEIALKVLYYAHVRSSLEYCSIIWDPIYRNKIEIIERIQNNFLRYLLYKKNGIYLQDISFSYLRDMFNTPSLCSRRDVSCVLFFYKGTPSARRTVAPLLYSRSYTGWWWRYYALGDVLMGRLRPVVVVEQTMVASNSLNITADQLHPYRAFVFPTGNGIFQQDNAPYHKVRIVLEWFEEHTDDFHLMSS